MLLIISKYTHLGSHLFQAINLWSAYISSKQETVDTALLNDVKYTTRVTSVLCIYGTYKFSIIFCSWITSVSNSKQTKSYLRSQLKLIMQYLNNRQTQVRHRRTWACIYTNHLDLIRQFVGTSLIPTCHRPWIAFWHIITFESNKTSCTPCLSGSQRTQTLQIVNSIFPKLISA